MRSGNPFRLHLVSVLALFVVVPLLESCAMNPASKTYTSYLTGSANPIKVQSGKLTVIATDSSDGGPLMRATVELVAADSTVRDPQYYRQSGISDRNGTVTFRDVPRRVNVSIVHARGSFALDNYVVPPEVTSEFRAMIDTTGPRTREECLLYLGCAR